MKRHFISVLAICMMSVSASAQFVVEKKNGETKQRGNNLQFTQNGGLEEWAVGDVYSEENNLSNIAAIYRSAPVGDTKIQAYGLEGKTAKLILDDATEVEVTFDDKGLATFAVPGEQSVIRSLVIDDATVAIGRHVGEQIVFDYTNGKINHREANADGQVPVGIVAELQVIPGNADLMAKSYIQEADLYLGGIEWTPIGVGYSDPFKGSYDGGNFKIHELTITQTETGTQYTAMFGGADGSVFKNITIASGKVQGFRYVAALLARSNSNVTIENCHNYAEVIAEGDNVGGLVAQGFSLTMKDCVNYGEVSGPTEVGGLAASSGGQIQNCKNYGYVHGARSGVAGLVCNVQSGTIDNCANYGTVEARIAVAGVANNVSGATISNCVNEGTIKAYSGAGGIVGSIAQGGKLDACENKGNIVAITPNPEDTEPNGAGGIAIQAGQSGTITNCTNHENVKFEGFVKQVGGIAGMVAKGEVSNCTNLAEMNYPEVTELGGIVGRNMGNIVSCKNTVNVSGKDYVGGITGYNHDGMKIRFCENEATVKGGSFVGGICGITWGTVSACVNRGTVEGTVVSTGGVCGAAGSQFSYVLASYNKGAVKGKAEVGGVCGTARQIALIEASYSVGTVEGEETLGGICGSLIEGSAVTESYWSGNLPALGTTDGSGTNTMYYFNDGTTVPDGATAGWPNTEVKNWGITPEGGQGTDNLWWKNLGEEGTANYPELWWEE